MTPGEAAGRSRRWGSAIIIATIGYIVVGGLALVFVPGWLLNDWVPAASAEERGRLLGTAAQIVLFGLGGVIATVGVTLSLFRHQQEVAAAERDAGRNRFEKDKELDRAKEARLQREAEAEREMRARFVTAVDLLSTEAPVKRTAAVYALAALADDWDTFGRPDEVQVCIDVICGYLRAPLKSGTTRTPEEQSVYTTGYSVISHRLRGDASHSWSGSAIDLTGATITARSIVPLGGAIIHDRGRLLLDRAIITGGARVQLSKAIIRGGVVSLQDATINDGARVWLDGLTIGEMGRLWLGGVVISQQGRVRLDGAVLQQGAQISLEGSSLSDNARVSLGGAKLGEGTKLWLNGAKIGSGGRLTLGRATIDHKANVLLDGLAVGHGGKVELPGATITYEADLTLSGASISDDGPVTLPDGRRLTPGSIQV